MSRTGVLLLFVALATVGAFSPADELPLVVPAEGESFRARLVATDDATWQFDQADGKRHALAADDLVLWGALAEPASGVQVVLLGGGLIVADGARLDKEQLQLDTSTFGKIELPLGSVAGVIFRPPAEQAAVDALVARALAGDAEADRVLLDNGDELTGTLSGSNEKLQLLGEAGPVEIPLNKPIAILFNPVLLDKPAPAGLRTLVGFRDGSRVAATSLRVSDGSARLQLAGDSELRAAAETILALQPLGGRAVYLSDLKPASYRHIPYLGLTWPYRADHSVSGRQLRAGGACYAKGLGMHSPARITYVLDGPYRRFQAEVAIDAEAGTRGSAGFRVFTDDGSGNWQQRAGADVVRGGQAPLPIAVDLDGVRRISLLVEFADRGDVMDHANWLNARLIR